MIAVKVAADNRNMVLTRSGTQGQVRIWKTNSKKIRIWLDL